MKKQIEVFDYANDILKAVKTGVLLTTKADDKVNTMTISWGTLGIEWGKTLFTVFVRENRFTKSQLDKNPEFTINIPVGDFNKRNRFNTRRIRKNFCSWNQGITINS